MDDRSENLFRWQWRHYPEGHRDRRNLLIHVLTVPVFVLGSASVLAAVATRSWPGLLGAVGMALAVAMQGRGHRLERTQPLPFRGPVDVVLRLIVEQWVTFPRFFVSGGFSRAWRSGSIADRTS